MAPATKRSWRWWIRSVLTVVFVVGFTVGVIAWGLVGVTAVLQRVLRDDIPPPPPAAVLPLPEGWAIAADDECPGGHCSHRTVTVHHSDMATPIAVPPFVERWTAAGWQVKDTPTTVDAQRDGITLILTKPDPAVPTVTDLKVKVDFVNDAAGRTYFQDGVLFVHVRGFWIALEILTGVTVTAGFVLWLTD